MIAHVTENGDMAQDTERRRHVRRAVLLQCRIEGTTVAGAMHITDLSESGCFIATSEALPVGSQVTLQIMVSGTDIPVIGRVVRVQSGRGFAVEIEEHWRQQLPHLLRYAF